MEGLIETIIHFGYAALFATVFAESGLFFGFFLPGDSLLFTAGLFAAKGDLNLWFIIIGCVIAAIAGDQVGYIFGHRMGKRLYGKKDTFFFRHEHIEKTKDFYQKYGKMTLILARFTPIVRTFAPIVAGVAEMPYKEFVTYNVAGGLLWAVGMPLLGYYLGKAIPDIDRYLLPIIAAIIIISLLPTVWHLFGSYLKRGADTKKA
jgi:membrane-associated protein